MKAATPKTHTITRAAISPPVSGFGETVTVSGISITCGCVGVGIGDGVRVGERVGERIGERIGDEMNVGLGVVVWLNSIGAGSVSLCSSGGSGVITGASPIGAADSGARGVD